MPKSPKIGKCAICGVEAPLTDDHIPPKCLFPKPRPKLITIKTCISCNGGTSKDDEYLRNMISMHHDIEKNEHAMKNNATMFRSFNYAEAKGLKRSFLRQVFEVEAHTNSGIYLGRKLAYTVDAKRVHRSLAKITRGLYFHHTGVSVASNFEIWVIAEDDVRQWPQVEKDRLHSQFLLPLMNCKPIFIGSKQFHYRYQFALENVAYSCWAFSFFETVPFVCMTVPKSD